MRLWFGRAGLLMSFLATLLVITGISTAHWGLVYDKIAPQWWALNFGFWEFCTTKCYPLTYVYKNDCKSPTCGGHHRLFNGTINSPSYNITTHKFAKTCVWIISAPDEVEHLCVTLTFHDLDLGASQSGNEEMLSIYNYENMDLLYRFSGGCPAFKENVITTHLTTMRLVFVGNANRGRGFNMSWTFDECPENANNRSLTIPPNYPTGHCFEVIKENIENHNHHNETNFIQRDPRPMRCRRIYYASENTKMLQAPVVMPLESDDTLHVEYLLPNRSGIAGRKLNSIDDDEDDADKDIDMDYEDDDEDDDRNSSIHEISIVAKETKCLAIIRSETGAVWVQFADFDLQCGDQHLYLYSGVGRKRKLLSGFCGDCKPGGKRGIMVANQMTLTFWSREGTPRSGREFIIRYAAVDPAEISSDQIFTSKCHSTDELPSWFVAARLVVVIATLHCLLALPLGAAAMCPKCCTKTGVLLGTVIIVSALSAVMFIGAVTTLAIHYKSWPLFEKYGALQELAYSSHMTLTGVALLCLSAILYLGQWKIVGDEDEEHIYQIY